MIRDPNEVLAQANTPPADVPEARKRGDVLASITASYFFLRRGLAFLALAFPVALFALAGFQDSLSAYYHCSRGGCGHVPGAGAARDVLVGVLWAAGTFLIFYRGYSRREDWALNLAGIAAAGVASFPADFNRAAGEGRSMTGKLHFTSGLVFFLAIAFVCIFCSGDTLKLLKDEAKRIWFKRIYSGLGAAMVVVPVAVFALYYLHHLLDRSGVNYAVYGVEVAGLIVFSAFWLLKSKEIALIEEQ